MSRPRYDLLRLVVIASILPLLGILLAGYLDYSAPMGLWVHYTQSANSDVNIYVRVHREIDASELERAFAEEAKYIEQLKAEIKQLREEVKKSAIIGTPNQVTVTNAHGSITLSTPQAIRTPLDDCKAALADMTKERDALSAMSLAGQVEHEQRALDECERCQEMQRRGFLLLCVDCGGKRAALDEAKKHVVARAGSCMAQLANVTAQLANMTKERDAWRRRAPLDAAVAKVEQREQELKRCRGPMSPTLGNCVVTGIKPDRYGRATEYHCFGCDAEEDNLDAAKKQLLAANACAADLDECRATQLAYDKEYYALAEACGMVDKAVHVARAMGRWVSDTLDSVTKSKP